MTRRPATLTAAFVRTVSKPGVYGDGRGSRGLSLRVHRMKSGRLSRTWRQRLRVAGRLTTTGLGRFPEVSLAEARHKAIENARAIGQGVDPRGGGVPTFREAAEETIRLHAESWKAGSPLPGEWHSTLRLYATPIRDKPVDRITSGDVLACLRPVWNVKPAAARKARNRLRAAFRWCVGQGYISTNPVDRAVAALPKVNGNGTTHHRALLRASELIVLTAARSGEARAATWDEIDTAAKVWTIPPARMKAGREHRVLLRASELADDSPFVFPMRAGRALSSKSTYRVLQLAGVTGTTLHGFRTSIRSWMAETGVDRETAEAVLAHVVRGTEGAYMGPPPAQRGQATRRCRAVVHHNTRVRERSRLFALPVGTAGMTRVDRPQDRQALVFDERPRRKGPSL